MDIKRITNKVARTMVAGWWGDAPVDGDTPLDIMGDIESYRGPKAMLKAVNHIDKMLAKGGNEAYGAMGVWDVVMSSRFKGFQSRFSDLSGDVSQAARKLLKDKNWLKEWGDSGNVEDWLQKYTSGRPTGKFGRVKFRPKALAFWEIQSVSETNNGDSVTVNVTILDTLAGERKSDEVEVHPPVDSDIVESNAQIVSGGPNSKLGTQQAIIVEMTDEDGNFFDAQIDVDQKRGGLTLSEGW